MSDSGQPAPAENLTLYTSVATDAAATVIAGYSTSFGLGTRLLGRPMRRHIQAVYAMVRVADEIVDTYRGADAGAVLDGFETTVATAMRTGFSADLVAHAFAATASAVGITSAQVDPFFESMRMDLHRTVHDSDSFSRYVHGSAEVVGEMCLAVFVNTGIGAQPLVPEVSEGARRLGAAYQKVNFLRDLGADRRELGRSYFPGIDADAMTDADLAALVTDCRADIDAARLVLSHLPRRPRIAVRTTIDIYSRLLDQIERTRAAELALARVRVSDPRKLAFAVRNLITGAVA